MGFADACGTYATHKRSVQAEYAVSLHSRHVEAGPLNQQGVFGAGTLAEFQPVNIHVVPYDFHLEGVRPFLDFR